MYLEITIVVTSNRGGTYVIMKTIYIMYFNLFLHIHEFIKKHILILYKYLLLIQ